MSDANIKKHPNCLMRHENGNCNPVGGFCTAVSTEICDAVHKAWNMSFHECVNLNRSVAKTIQLRGEQND